MWRPAVHDEACRSLQLATMINCSERRKLYFFYFFSLCSPFFPHLIIDSFYCVRWTGHVFYMLILALIYNRNPSGGRGGSRLLVRRWLIMAKSRSKPPLFFASPFLRIRPAIVWNKGKGRVFSFKFIWKLLGISTRKKIVEFLLLMFLLKSLKYVGGRVKQEGERERLKSFCFCCRP